jgi:hypothetical protein
MNDARRGLEADLLTFAAGSVAAGKKLRAEPGETTRAVAAHLGFTAIGIEVAHAQLGLVGRRHLGHEHAVGPDAAVPIAEAGDDFRRELPFARPVVEQDEVVAGAVHLGEVQRVHGREGECSRA